MSMTSAQKELRAAASMSRCRLRSTSLVRVVANTEAKNQSPISNNRLNPPPMHRKNVSCGVGGGGERERERERERPISSDAASLSADCVA